MPCVHYRTAVQLCTASKVKWGKLVAAELILSVYLKLQDFLINSYELENIEKDRILHVSVIYAANLD